MMIRYQNYWMSTKLYTFTELVYIKTKSFSVRICNFPALKLKLKFNPYARKFIFCTWVYEDSIKELKNVI